MNLFGEQKLFSFKIGGVDAWNTEYAKESREEENTITTTYTFANGLRVTNILKKYTKFDAYEWQNHFENTSDKPTDIISELWDCNCTLPIEYEEELKYTAQSPDISKVTKIYAPSGSTWDTLEFYCNVDDYNRTYYIFPGQEKEYHASNGRASELYAPFMNISKNNKGYIFAIGWSGQWKATVNRTNDEIIFKSKVEDTDFRIMPGESFRTSSIVIMPYEGDFASSQNVWRRFIKDEITPLGKGSRPKRAPISAAVWGGMTSDEVLKRIEIIDKNDVDVDCVWMDAGWYGIDTKPTPDEFEGDWPCHTGDWRVSPLIHPQKLKDVSKAVHDSGRKFLLWFEPERVIKTTPIALEHPEYFLYGNNDNDNVLLNLGNVDAWEYCHDMLYDKIVELNIDWLRIDYNFDPLVYFRSGDSNDRRGITEIKYINGFYKLWDTLLNEFPHLMIDDCASGGRRIDIETLKRSVPLWRSDFQCPANYPIVGSQCHNQCFSEWLPYSGTGAGRGLDEYRVRSAYAPGLNLGYFYSQKDGLDDAVERVAFMKKYAAEAKIVREYMSGDFYPLTEVSDRLDIWCANQFDRPECKDGMIQVFRRENSPYESATFKLSGIDNAADYVITDIDGGSVTVSGDVLCENGFKVDNIQKRTAKIYFYKKV